MRDLMELHNGRTGKPVRLPRMTKIVIASCFLAASLCMAMFGALFASWDTGHGIGIFMGLVCALIAGLLFALFLVFCVTEGER